ncbi:hypothetical protein D3C73_1620230 [compost metagenome]
MVDLEGRKNAERAVVTFAESSQDDVEISYSYDGKLFKRLFFGKLSDKPSVEVDLSGGPRYLKVYFPQNPVAVRQIEIFD